jgi:hypothetical protein
MSPLTFSYFFNKIEHGGEHAHQRDLVPADHRYIPSGLPLVSSFVLVLFLLKTFVEAFISARVLSSAMTFATLVAQIESVSSVIRGLETVHPAAAARIEESQAKLLSSSFSKGGLDMHGVAKLIESISSSAFKPSVQDVLKKHLAEAPMCELEMDAESSFQNWESLHKFVPQSIASISGTVAFGCELMKFVIRGGLWKPSEKTYRMLALTMLVGSAKVETILGMPKEDRIDAIESTKDLYRKALDGKEPSRLMMKLPATPAKLQVACPELYQTWYRDDPPVGLAVDDLSMDILRAGTRCRKEKTCKVFKQMGRLGDNKDDLKMLICNLAKSFGRTQHDDMKIRMVGPRALADDVEGARGQDAAYGRFPQYVQEGPRHGAQHDSHRFHDMNTAGELDLEKQAELHNKAKRNSSEQIEKEIEEAMKAKAEKQKEKARKASAKRKAKQDRKKKKAGKTNKDSDGSSESQDEEESSKDEPPTKKKKEPIGWGRSSGNSSEEGGETRQSTDASEEGQSL